MPNMKTLGAVLIVLGLLVSLLGYGLYEHAMCNCVSAVGASPVGCHCGSVLQPSTGHTLVYIGLAIAGSGMIVFAKWWRKKIIFN